MNEETQPNPYQHLIDAANHQFGELGREQLRGGFISVDYLACCYLGAYALEKGFDPMIFKNREERAALFVITTDFYDLITFYNDAGMSWQEINAFLESGGGSTNASDS